MTTDAAAPTDELVAPLGPDESETANPVLGIRRWDKLWMGPFLDALATVPNVSAACRIAGVSRNPPYMERAANPEFREAWDAAVEVATELAEQIVYRRGSTGEPRVRTTTKTRVDSAGNIIERETVVTEEQVISNQMLIAWLRAQRPDRWGDRVEHRHGGAADGIPIVHEHEHRVRTPERLAALVDVAIQAGMIEAEIGPDGVARVRVPGHTPELETAAEEAA